jgi:glycosyltransferase involved in cell wall biosynthesis
VYRDTSSGGKSVEEIFHNLEIQLKEVLPLVRFDYSDSIGFIKNGIELRAVKARIYHITAGVYQIACFIQARKVVLTIHDIGRFKELRGFRRFIYGIWYLRLPMLLASRITTVSSYSKEDILQYFGKSLENKLTIIPNPIPHLFRKDDREFNVNQPVVLQVGTGANKNLESVVLAIAGSRYRLVVIGKLSVDQRHLLESNNIDFENHHSLTYEEVFYHYCEADIISFVSLHEGFGMPVLEGQAVGRPVIASMRCSLPEVGGKGAHYVQNPFDVTEIRAGLDRIVADKSYRTQLIFWGYQNIRRFKTQKIASQYLKVYQELLT